MRKKVALICALVLSFVACKHSLNNLGDPLEQPPANLVYSIDTMVVLSGNAGQSVIPTLDGLAPFQFFATTAPFSFGAISIDPDGVISADSALQPGNYDVTISVTNEFGAATFQNIYHVISTATIDPPTGFSYPTDTLFLQNGDGGTSGLPSVNGTPTFSYTMSVAPTTADISIDAGTGEITVATTLVDGTYSVDATVTNASGSQTLLGALTVIVSSNPFPPTGLIYPIDSLFLLSGSGGNSGLPTVSGTAPFTYTMNSTPTSGDISINANDGEITAAATLVDGTYNLDVTVSNATGSDVLNNALVIIVSTVIIPPTGLVYNPDFLNLVAGNGGSSVTPSINGNTPLIWSMTSTPNAGAAISINSNGIITVSPALAVGSYVIDVTCTNSGGSQTWPGVYTVNMTGVPVTFTNDILPIIIADCSNCHTGGGQGPVQTNYTIYANAVNEVTLILDRIQRNQGSPGFMPKNGVALSAAEIQLFIQWQTDGLQQ